MDYFLTVDWAETFVPQLTLPEVLLRGTIVYIVLLALLRVIPKWETGTGSIASMLFAVMLGGLAADAVKGKGESITDILLMVLTVVAWVVVVDWLSAKFPWFHFLAQDPPACLIRNGEILWKTVRREMLSEEDLKTELRRQDVDDISRVREAYLEADGSISVVKREEGNTRRAENRTTPKDECGSDDEPRRERTGPCHDDEHQQNGHHPDRRNGVLLSEEGNEDQLTPADQDAEEPELADFLAAAEKLKARLDWHEEQAAKFKKALAEHGVRIKPPTSSRRKTTRITKPK